MILIPQLPTIPPIFSRKNSQVASYCPGLNISATPGSALGINMETGLFDPIDDAINAFSELIVLACD